MERILSEITKEDVVDLLQIPDNHYSCKVVDVYDGDTCDIVLFTEDHRLVATRVRIYGINTSEMRGGTDETKIHAIAARTALIRMVTGITNWSGTKNEFPSHKNVISAHVHNLDSFGRALATLYVDGYSVGDKLLEAGLAVPYVK